MAISRMAAPISSAPLATACTPALTSPAAVSMAPTRTDAWSVLPLRLRLACCSSVERSDRATAAAAGRLVRMLENARFLLGQ
jgi:hypothetical protein